MTNLFKHKRLSDITLKNIAVEIVLGIIKPEHISGRIPTPLIPALEELLEEYDSYKDAYGPLAVICRLYNDIQDNHQQAFYWKIIEPELKKPELHRDAFVIACKYGNFLTAQWLYELATPEQKIDMLEAKDNYHTSFGAFRLACAKMATNKLLHGSMTLQPQNKKQRCLRQLTFLHSERLAKMAINKPPHWLYNLATPEQQKIDLLKADNFEAFQLACENGHHQIAKWLYDDLANTLQLKNNMLEAQDFCGASFGAFREDRLLIGNQQIAHMAL